MLQNPMKLVAMKFFLVFIFSYSGGIPMLEKFKTPIKEKHVRTSYGLIYFLGDIQFKHLTKKNPWQM